MRKQSRTPEAAIIDKKIMSKAHLYRIEAGLIPVNVKDVWALCRIYGADNETIDALTILAEGTLEQNWWEDYYSDVVEAAGVAIFIGVEEVANEIRTYESELVPGLFQTSDYTRAINCVERPDWDESAVNRRVNLRRERQRKVLRRENPPRIIAVLNEPVLIRPVGGSQVMAAQLKHLHGLAALDYIDIRVLPLDVGEHAAMGKSFAILDPANSEDYPPLVHIDDRVGGRDMEKPEQVNSYRMAFGLVQKKTISLKEYEAR